MARWEIVGTVDISRTGDRTGEVLNHPFVMYSPYPGAPPVPSEIEAFGRQRGQEFLDLLTKSNPASRAKYGAILDVTIVSLHIVES